MVCFLNFEINYLINQPYQDGSYLAELLISKGYTVRSCSHMLLDQQTA